MAQPAPNQAPSTIDRGATRGRGAQAAGLLALGLVASAQVPGAPVWAWAALIGAGALLAAGTSGRVCSAGLALAMVACGGAWMTARVWTEDDSLAHTRAWMPREDAQGGVLVRATGVVASAPRVRNIDDGWWQRRDDLTAPRVALVGLDLKTLGPADGRPAAPAQGRVWLAITPASAAAGWKAGDPVEVVGRARGVEAPTMPGQRDARRSAVQDGVVGFIAVQGDGASGRLPSEEGPGGLAAAMSWTRRQIDTLRAAAREILDTAPGREGGRAIDPRDRQAAALIGALLLGDDDAALEPVVESWGRLGLLHALSISGFHIAVMAGLALTLVRLTGDRGHAESLVALGLLVVYLLIVPAEAPVLRSGFSIGAILLAEALGRRYDRLSVLGWTAVGLLLWRPLDVFDAGFQLSFGLTATLLVLGASTHRWLFSPRGVRGRVRPRLGPAGLVLRAAFRALGAMISAGILAWAVATPIVAYHFGLFSPFTVIAGLLVVPIIVPALWLGYLTLLVGAVWPAAGAWSMGALTGLGRLMVDLTAWLDDLPGAGVPLPAIPWWLVALGVSTAVLVFVRRRLGDPRVLIAVGLTLTLSALVIARVARGPGELTVEPIGVPGGSCTLVRRGAQSVIIDAGSTRRGVVRRAAREVPAAVRALGGWKAPTLIITRADPSAWSFAPALARPLDVSRALIAPRLWALAHGRPGSPEAALLARLRERGVNVERASEGEGLDLGGGVRLELVEDADGDLRVAVQRAGGPTSWIPSSVEPAK